jgi:hypothetical protein
MLKRRVAIVVTVAALGLAGMAGSALADDRPGGGLVRVHGDAGEPVAYGGRLTCWLSDGKVVKFSKAKVAEFIEEDFIGPDLTKSDLAESDLAWPVTEDGITTVPEDRLSISVPAKELPRKVGKRWHRNRVIHLTCVWDGHVSR